MGDTSYPAAASPSPEEGMDGKVGASVRGATPCSQPILCSSALPHLRLCAIFCFLLELRVTWDGLFSSRVLHACTSATVLLHSSSNEDDKQRCPLGFTVATRWDRSESPALAGALPSSSPTSATPVEPWPWHRGGRGCTWSKAL